MIEIKNIENLLSEPKRIEEIRSLILSEEIVILKRFIDPNWIDKVKNYLSAIGKCSLPNYHELDEKAPNFHRLNRSDSRAFVKGCFHQFSFFPWNQDVFNFFEFLKFGFQFKNLVNGLPMNKFLSSSPEDGCFSRVTFQFYPSGSGYLNKHSDPVDKHQLAVPTLTMSKKGHDFNTGGAYVELPNGEKVITDSISEVGDLILFNAKTPHGVEMIDSNDDNEWLSFKGRWVMLFATNKLSTNNNIIDSVDLGNS